MNTPIANNRNSQVTAFSALVEFASSIQFKPADWASSIMNRVSRTISDVTHSASRLVRFSPRQLAKDAVSELAHGTALLVDGSAKVAGLTGSVTTKTVASVGKMATHMVSMATAGVILAGGAIAVNAAIAAVRGTGTLLSGIGNLMNHPKDSLHDLKKNAGALCTAVKAKIEQYRRAKSVRKAADDVLSGYKRGNIGHWFKSTFGRHEPVEVKTQYKTTLDGELKASIGHIAQLARLAYSGIRETRKPPLGFQKAGLEELPKTLRDFYDQDKGLIRMPSGFKAFVAKQGKTVHLSFAGSEFGLRLLGSDREGTYQADYLQRFGLYSPMYRDAVAVTKLFKELCQKEEGASLHLSGHSLGGGLAQFAATANEVPATCFNAAGMSAGSLAMLGKEKVDKVNGEPALITHIRVKGDPVSDGGGGRLGPVQVNAKGTEIGTVITLDHPGNGGSATAHFMSTVVSALEGA